ncbi:hypothetical protein [Sphingomonas bacterium]|uniref:hypothetical protein n=1 Tax=Sphingomonas bacterium TaxID=1895847 RepID=UPI002629BE50|nr:hypothetical protein [Sphingomonas bacterium]
MSVAGTNNGSACCDLDAADLDAVDRRERDLGEAERPRSPECVRQDGAQVSLELVAVTVERGGRNRPQPFGACRREMVGFDAMRCTRVIERQT